jgi:spermidine/putrescine transport system permease protein
MTKQSITYRGTFALPHVLWQTVFFSGPLAFLFLASLRRYELGRPRPGLTLINYRSLFVSSPFLGALGKSLILAVGVSILSMAMALAAILGAWLIENVKLRMVILTGSALVFFAGVIPRTYVLEFLLSDRGLLGRAWSMLNITPGTFALYSTSGIIAAYLPILLPLCIAILYVSRRDVPSSYVDAATDLGAGWLTIQRRVIIPVMKPGIVISLVLTFILVAGDVVVVDLVGGAQTYTASTQIIDYVKVDDWGSAAAASVVLLAIIGMTIAAGTALILRGQDS